MRGRLALLVALACSLGASSLHAETTIDVDSLARMSLQEIDALASGLAAEEIIRTKRSGSGDILGSVSKAISSGIGSKLALVGQASAGASSLFSGGSSKGHDEHQYDGYSYDHPMTYNTKSFDFWTLKKSILNTLLQAVKAITGGVAIIKGQLIKGGGALVSGVGKLVTVKGEAVTNLGRNIVNSASLVPPKKKGHHHVVHTAPAAPIHHPVSSYGPPTAPAYHFAPTAAAPSYSHGGPPHIAHYEAPSPAPLYGSPISHNSIFGSSNKYSQPFEGLKQQQQQQHHHGELQAGVIVLQPVKSSVSSAVQALKGIFDESAPTLSPPPPPYPQSSYQSVDQLVETLPPFKPLGHDSYGAPSVDLQAMVDSLVVSHMNELGPTYDSYLSSFPNPESDHGNHQFATRQLQPGKLDKIVANVDKIKVHRSDDSPEDDERSQSREKYTYELRGNRLVRLATTTTATGLV